MNDDHEVIKFTDAFFYDAYSQIKVSPVEEEYLLSVETTFNTFKDCLDMTDGKVPKTTTNILLLEYFQMFLMLLSSYHLLSLREYGKEDANIAHMAICFKVNLSYFVNLASDIRSGVGDVFERMEVDIFKVRSNVNDFVNICFCSEKDDDQLTPPPAEINIDPPKKVIKMPDSYFEEEKPKTTEEKFEEQELLQAMEVSRMNWAVDRLIIFLEAAATACCFAGLGLILARIFVATCDRSGDYEIDNNFIRYIAMIIVILIISNIRKISNYFKEK